MNQILCGLPMSGKTTIGNMLAGKLRMNFIDTDRMIEAAHARMFGKKCSCRQIFIERGESYFRDLERKQIETLPAVEQTVIALGGGALNHPEIIKTLQSAGRIIYLKAPPEILWQRMLEKGAPAYIDPSDPEGSFYALADKRSHIYEKACDATIETERLTPNEVVEAIIYLMEVSHGK